MPTDKYLLPTSQRNQVLKSIERQGLDPAAFKWTEKARSVNDPPRGHGEGLVSVLLHSSTGYSFTFDLRHTAPLVEFVPGSKNLKRVEPCKSLPEAMDHVLEWLSALKKEVDAPNLWAEIVQASRIIEAADAAEDKPFSPKQKQHLIADVDEIRRLLIEQHELTGERLKLVESEIDYLKGAVDRLSQRDWGMVVFTTFVNIAIKLGLDPEGAGDLLQLVGSKLTQVVDGITKFLP